MVIKRTMAIIVLTIVLLCMLACSAHVHSVGDGPRTGDSYQQRQWYALWGLIPLNEVDTNHMAGNSIDYEIKTETRFIDFVISYFTGFATINCRSVTVTR